MSTPTLQDLDTAATRLPYAGGPRPSQYLVHAQHALTGTWLYRDVPYNAGTVAWGLGDDSLQLTVQPELTYLRDPSGQRPLFDEWATFIYLEKDDELRWGGILNRTDDAGPQRVLNAIGFAAYPNGMTYDGPDYSKIQVDPLDVVRYMWGYIQGHPRGDLGFVVDATTSSVRLGTPAVPADPKVADSVATDAEPYLLAWYNGTDMGAEMQSLGDQVPFDMRDQHAWVDDSKQAVSHRLRLGVPRLGVRQNTLAFVEGENVVEALAPSRDATTYGNEVTGVGAGDGSTTVRATVSVDDGRLWRPVTYTDKSLTTAAAVQARASKQLVAVAGLDEVQTVVAVDHPNAPFGAFSAGDDVPVTQLYGWGAPRTVLSRITSMSLDLQTEKMTLTCARSDSFTYAPTTT